MPKTSQKIINQTQKNSLLATLPWSCTHFGSESEIEAYIASLDKWVCVADVHSVADIDAEDIADFIVQAVTQYAKSFADK